METAVNPNFEVYYSGQYWNDIPRVLEYMCENFTGDKNKWWVDDFKERFAKKSFERGLFLNCGNGWVEREFIDKGIVQSALGFDFSLDLLKIAEQEKGGRNIGYMQSDVNKVDFSENQFDLVVNVAAMHHVQYINRLYKILCSALQPDGFFVNFDYIGPRRNQYSFKHWRELNRVNQTLPLEIRKEPFIAPHLPTMLADDPTEAIHSDLIIPYLHRYFDILERHDTGGGIAYEILTHNSKIQSISPEELIVFVEEILSVDEQFTKTGKVPPLFSYFIARPRKTVLQNLTLLEKYNNEELKREQWAWQHSGVYNYKELILLNLNKLYHRIFRSAWLRFAKRTS